MTSKHVKPKPRTPSKKRQDSSAKKTDMTKARQVKARFGNWEILQHADPKLTHPILIEGMPGIGNVGKISMDVLIEESGAQLLMSFFAYDLPNSVFVNESNLVDLPSIELYYVRVKNKDFLLLTGDVQPTSERSSYELSEIVLDIAKSYDVEHILTLGGIGLNEIPEDPKIYITGNDAHFISSMKKSLEQRKLRYDSKIYGLVGPILGVSGLLLGLAKRRGIPAYSLLAETFGHPVYVGLKGARSILRTITALYSFSLKLDKLEREIHQIDAQLKGLSSVSEEDFDAVSKYKKYGDINYIG